MALIKCDGISIAYEGQTVVRDLSFWIEQGDYLCIVGENGSGKSTLVKSLLGLKPPFKADSAGRRIEARRNRVSSPADGRAERFSGKRL